MACNNYGKYTQVTTRGEVHDVPLSLGVDCYLSGREIASDFLKAENFYRNPGQGGAPFSRKDAENLEIRVSHCHVRLGEPDVYTFESELNHRLVLIGTSKETGGGAGFQVADMHGSDNNAAGHLTDISAPLPINAGYAAMSNLRLLVHLLRQRLIDDGGTRS